MPRKREQHLTVPALFWWLSLAGTLMLLCYAHLSDKNSILIFALCLPVDPLPRNLIIHSAAPESGASLRRVRGEVQSAGELLPAVRGGAGRAELDYFLGAAVCGAAKP